MKEEVTLNIKEQRRLVLLNQVEVKRLSRDKAKELMGISLRQLKRIIAVYRKEGAAGLAHGNRGKRPHNALDEELKMRVLGLAREKYTGFNFQHFTDSLKNREGIDISRSTVRRILLKAGITSPKKRRSPKHRSRRERYPQEGMMLQIDASPHPWLEERGPSFTLIGAIDDATGKVPYAFFQEHEDNRGYFLLLQGIVERYGIPLALYHDRHTIFQAPENELESIEEQLDGEKKLTQFGRLLKELGITSISANSPQAKGRVERLWKTFQDRLVSELRLAKATTMEEADKVLADYLLVFNRDFQVAPLVADSAYRKTGRGFIPDRYFCNKYKRVVGADNVIKFKGKRIQIMPINERASFAHAHVEVHKTLDDSLVVCYQGDYLKISAAPAEAPLQRAESADLAPLEQVRRKTTIPAPNHPWRTASDILDKKLKGTKSLNN
jgi:Integrase core domain.